MVIRGKSTRADIFSLIIMVVVMLVVVIIYYFFSLMNNNIVYSLYNSGDFNNSNMTMQGLNEMKDKPIILGDLTLVLLFVGWMVALIISAMYTNFNPAMIIFFFILLLFVVWMQMQTANFYEELSSSTIGDIQGTHGFIMSNFVFKKAYPVITFILGIVMMIIMYAKRDSGGQF